MTGRIRISLSSDPTQTNESRVSNVHRSTIIDIYTNLLSRDGVAHSNHSSLVLISIINLHNFSVAVTSRTKNIFNVGGNCVTQSTNVGLQRMFSWVTQVRYRDTTILNQPAKSKLSSNRDAVTVMIALQVAPCFLSFIHAFLSIYLWNLYSAPSR